ncbi:hypothetical protein D3C84_1254800 [compost metagenome]
MENSAAYVGSWLRKLKDDKKLIVQAAGQAQKSADYILGVTFEDAEEPRGSAAPIQGPFPGWGRFLLKTIA